jgi:cytochrome c oxidase subunit 4
METHSTGHAKSGINGYLVVFGALVVFTAISFIVNSAVKAGSIGKETGFALILGVAVCKAVLVGVFFMHLLFDWRRLYFVIIPVMVLAVLLVIVLLPDAVIAWHHEGAVIVVK